jgi:hypothetical protein
MKTDITLKLDKALLRDARALADERGVSLSSLLSDYLEQVVSARNDYARARKRALARLRKGLDLRWAPPGSRHELHDR